MLVPDLILDVLLFGALLLAALLDSFVPGLAGVASLLAVSAALYVAAQELSSVLEKRGGWSQESLATSLSLCTAGFIYYWWRNQSDLALLILSVGLMMASLMVTIALLASIGAAFRHGSAAPFIGFLLTVGGSIVLGVLAGLLILALGRPATESPLWMKAVLIGVSALAWKLRQSARPPQTNPAPGTTASDAELPAPTPATSPPARPILIPQSGRLLDRFLPALILGALLFVLSQRDANWFNAPFAPSANADTAQVRQLPPGQPPAPPSTP
jgi:hypothetical protein